MTQKKAIAIWIPILAVLLAIATAATALMNHYALTMDMVLGKGERKENVIPGSENWNTVYYENKYNSGDAALKAATETARQAANEGIVLLKNAEKDGAPMLPLQEGASVTPFGYRYIVPIYCPLGSASTCDDYNAYTVTNA